MEHELDLLLGTVIDSLAKLSVLVYLQENPELAQSPEEVAARVHRQPEAVASALAELAEAKLVERFPIGTGRIVIYAASDDAHVRSLLEPLGVQYRQGGEARAELVRRTLRLMRRREENPARGI